MGEDRSGGSGGTGGLGVRHNSVEIVGSHHKLNSLVIIVKGKCRN